MRPWLLRILRNLHLSRVDREKRQPVAVDGEVLDSLNATGDTAEETHTRLMNALCELNLTAEISVIGDACSLTQSASPDNASSGGDEVETDKR